MATIVPQIGNDLSLEMFVAANLGRFFQNLYSRGVGYFETLQPATNYWNYIFYLQVIKKRQPDLLQQAMPSEEMEYANITQKLGVLKLQSLVNFAWNQLVWLSWLVGWLNNWLVN